jgi:methionyl aminopeptidase
MIVLKSSREIEIMREANEIVVAVMDHLKTMIEPGITTAELDNVAEAMILERSAKPAFKGYLGYKHALCTSVNSQVVHGIPGSVSLGDGDIISVDCGVYYNGFYGDHAWTFAVGSIDEDAKKLLKVAEEALFKGIEKAVVGNRLYDISAAIQAHVEQNGFSVVTDYVGHGIGRKLHEDPQVPNFGEAGTGIKLRPGLVLALEPMVNMGKSEVKLLPDEWTVVTEDGMRSAHFEHSIAITESGTQILSKLG